MGIKTLNSRKEVCEELSIGTTKLHELLNAGKLGRPVKIGRKTLIRGEAIAAFLEAA